MQALSPLAPWYSRWAIRTRSGMPLYRISQNCAAPLRNSSTNCTNRKRLPKIKEFANEGVQVNLAVSLHAPNNDLRSSIMRINRSFPLEKLFEAIEYYIQTTLEHFQGGH